MKWLNKEDNPPPKASILVFCKNCSSTHRVDYDYDEWCLVEYCREDGHHVKGVGINFDFWMPLPEPPLPLTSSYEFLKS